MDSETVTEQQLDLEHAVKEYLETGSQDAREKVIALGQTMAGYFANLYSPGSADHGMKRAASTGFLKALKRFDPQREVQFSTYATHCIISEIREELKNRQLFRVPDWLKKLQDDVVRATEELTRENQMMPTLQEIANKVNVAENGIAEAMQAGTVALDNLDLKSIKSLRHEAFKLPVEDVITIRKSLDRLGDIQLKVLSLFSANLRELRLAMEEEEKALSREQEEYLKMVENGSQELGILAVSSFKLDFPFHFAANQVKSYFEVLADEYGLRLTDIKYLNAGKDPVSSDREGEDSNINKSIELMLEGRYRGLLQLLDYLRNDEEAVLVERVRTTRNETIPARISIFLLVNARFKELSAKEQMLSELDKND
jgi:RNA polymerase sigma-B factor